MNSGHPIVDQIGRMHLSGTVIPTRWFNSIVFSNGKPHLSAILILADVMYWYRPTVERDEESGHIIKVKKKFAKDMMHRTYQKFAEQFGISKRQAKEACDFLEDLDLIKREFRTLIIKGIAHNNVMFIAPIPDKVSSITYEITESESDTLLRSNVPPSYVLTEEAPTLERKTNTLITTNITKDIIVYLNEQADKSYRPTTQKTKSLILARIKEGFSLDDFKRVIDNKVADWKGNSNYDVYLRPETLFGNKFEGYLNENKNLKKHGNSEFAEFLEEG